MMVHLCVDDNDNTHVARTTADEFLEGHTTACLTWRETEKTDGSHGMHRFVARSL